MQHQQNHITEEFETEKRRQAARVRRDNLSEAMETLANRRGISRPPSVERGLSAYTYRIHIEIHKCFG